MEKSPNCMGINRIESGNTPQTFHIKSEKIIGVNNLILRHILFGRVLTLDTFHFAIGYFFEINASTN